MAASCIQNIAEWGGGDIVTAKEEDWKYEMPPLGSAVDTVVVSLDEAKVPMADSTDYREGMVGTLLFCDDDGERQHSIYLAAVPEYGKSEFKQRMKREIACAKQHFPEAQYIGIADGAAGHWSFLEQHTQRQLIDFFDAVEYIGKIAQALYPQHHAEGKHARWQNEHCKKLKSDPDVLEVIIEGATRLSHRRRSPRMYATAS